MIAEMILKMYLVEEPLELGDLLLGDAHLGGDGPGLDFVHDLLGVLLLLGFFGN